MTKINKYAFRDVIPFAVARVYDSLRGGVHSIITKLLMLWWHVSFAKGLSAYGIPIIRKHPTSRVIIGNNATFRSAEWSNTVGINRRCILSVSRDAKIVIGNNCGFSGTVIAASESIVIGDRVMCGANCTLLDIDRHPVDPVDRAENKKAKSAPIFIEDDVWLGMNVVVLKGVSIGRGTVVTANSVVTKSLPPNVIAGGIPANVIKGMLSQELD